MWDSVVKTWIWWADIFGRIPLGDPYVATLVLILIVVALGMLAVFTYDHYISD